MILRVSTDVLLNRTRSVRSEGKITQTKRKYLSMKVYGNGFVALGWNIPLPNSQNQKHVFSLARKDV